MKKSKATSDKKIHRRRRKQGPDYVLQGSEFDLSMETVLGFSIKQRKQYINSLLDALAKTIRTNKFSLKSNVPFKKEMRDLRRVLYGAADQYLLIDDRTNKRNVLGAKTPGSTHTNWSRSQMWKMKTKAGDLSVEIRKKSPQLINKLTKLLDPANEGKAGFRKQSVLRSILVFLQTDKHSGSGFPPFHAKFFADKFLPKDEDGIVVDPCAGWGGRLLGSLLVNRKHHVQYYGVDPEVRNKDANDGLTRRVNVYFKKETRGPRDATLFYKPFEDWVRTKAAKSLMGKADLVITSPPYFGAENYNPKNPRQSANRYPEYTRWRQKFYRPLVKGAYALLKPNGYFVLNIANVIGAPKLERDARKLAAEAGFVGDSIFKLAMEISPEAKNVRHLVIVNGNRFKYEPVFVFRKPNDTHSRKRKWFSEVG